MRTHGRRLDACRLLLTTTLLLACAPDRGTAPVRHLKPIGASNNVAAEASEQLLYQQPPLPSTNLFTGGEGLDLAATLQGSGLPDGTFTSLQVKLNLALSALAEGDDAAACRAFQDLINATTAQSGKKLTEVQANEIIAEATRIRGIIGCE